MTTQRTTTATPEIVTPAGSWDPTPHGYSAVVVAPPGARLAFVSGLRGQDAAGGLAPDFATQVRQAYANLAVALDGLDAAPDRVVKLMTFVVDHEVAKLETLTRAVVDLFGDRLPAQTLVPVPSLAQDAMLFEVEAVVALD
ncbi:RidA family protein [Jannaschia sp. LMIT008]|uniref:RidA family protein n=1 Tax=Jannaschia maritima TaxID=3032585 RepID=UPI0028127B3F|nr:RidA family protein [Jannaschia sp. LMIT008]